MGQKACLCRQRFLCRSARLQPHGRIENPRHAVVCVSTPSAFNSITVRRSGRHVHATLAHCDDGCTVTDFDEEPELNSLLSEAEDACPRFQTLLQLCLVSQNRPRRHQVVDFGDGRNLILRRFDLMRVRTALVTDPNARIGHCLQCLVVVNSYVVCSRKGFVRRTTWSALYCALLRQLPRVTSRNARLANAPTAVRWERWAKDYLPNPSSLLFDDFVGWLYNAFHNTANVEEQRHRFECVKHFLFRKQVLNWEYLLSIPSLLVRLPVTVAATCYSSNHVYRERDRVYLISILIGIGSASCL